MEEQLIKPETAILQGILGTVEHVNFAALSASKKIFITEYLTRISFKN